MAASDPAADYLWNRRGDILFKTWVQLRLNRKRQRFFDLIDKATKALTIVLGGTLFGRYMTAPEVGVGVVALGLLALVFGYSDRKQMHKELAERAAEIIQSVEKVPPGNITDQLVADWTASHAALIGKSPPPLKILTQICEHEQSVAGGNPPIIPCPNWLLCWVRHFW